MGLFGKIKQILGHPRKKAVTSHSKYKKKAKKNLGHPRYNRKLYDLRYEKSNRKRMRLTLRVEPHIKLGIKSFCDKQGTTVSQLSEALFGTLLYSKNKDKMIKLTKEHE